MSFTKITDPKGKTNDLEIIRAGLASLEGRVYFITPDSDTIQGPPTSGTYAVSETWIDKNRSVFVCTVAGSPGTWKQIMAPVMDAFPTGTIPTGYEVVRDDLQRRRYRWDGSEWIRIGRYRHLQVSQQQTWTVTHNLGYKPASVAVWIDGELNGTGIEHIDNNSFYAYFDTAVSGELIVE